ncbi:MAG TPA: hypothetical protein VK689_16150, partial [Armatimonadota bacterium]|nr:hypothetical protein [Armatimonadota bacterium]
LTPDELQDVMSDAISRHSDAERRREEHSTLATVEDALEIARTLNIPEEHVRAAVADRQRHKLRAERRAAARRSRGNAFMLALALSAPVLLFSLRGGVLRGGLVIVLLLALVNAFLAWRWLAAPVTDAEADRVELMPVPGKCRVCGAPAYTPRATFCEAHRYKGPGGGEG